MTKRTIKKAAKELAAIIKTIDAWRVEFQEIEPGPGRSFGYASSGRQELFTLLRRLMAEELRKDK